MLEIGIIISLALVLFLSLKNFPKTLTEFSEIDASVPELNMVNNQKARKRNFWQRFSKRKEDNNLNDILKAISSDQEKIVPPSEINEAQKSFKEENPEIVKLLYEADQAFDQNDLRGAEDLAIKALSQNKKSAYAYVIMGNVALNRGVLDDAKEAFLAAIKCDHEIGEAYYGLGEVELKDENLTEAIEYFQKSVNLNRGMALWYAELGKAYMQIRQFAKAAKALKRASSLEISNQEYRDLASEAEEKQRAHSTAFRRR